MSAITIPIALELTQPSRELLAALARYIDPARIDDTPEAPAETQAADAAIQATHSHQEQVAIARLLRKRGHAVAGDLTKVFRTTTCEPRGRPLK